MKGGGAQKMEVSRHEPSGQTLALSSSDITKPQKPHLPLKGFAKWTNISGLYLHWKQLFNLAEQTAVPAQLIRKENDPMWATSIVWHSFLGYNKEQDQFSWCFLGCVGSLLLPYISALFEKCISSPQLPAFLWDKGTLTTAISDPAYLVQVLSFISLLMTLLILVT